MSKEIKDTQKAEKNLKDKNKGTKKKVRILKRRNKKKISLMVSHMYNLLLIIL